MHYRKNLLLPLIMSVAISADAASTSLSLDSCRTLALANNKELRAAEMERRAAHYGRKSAFTAYLPKVSASGIYMHTDRELSLLSDEQKSGLSHIGSALSVPALNSVGQRLVDALRTDTRNMYGAAVMLTQPIYMGGKIRAYNKIAGYVEQIADHKLDLCLQDLIVDVEETYWNIVALTSKKHLAESYLNLVRTLDSDVEKLKAEGFATEADCLSVKVKVNEAKVTIIQVDNGLELLRMRLCQLCGLPLDDDVVPADAATYSAGSYMPAAPDDTNLWLQRPELSAVGNSVRISEEKIKIARSEFLPSVALTGGYVVSNPSVFNSFEKKFKGTWNIGVALNIPILTWGDRAFKVKSAKAEAISASFRYDELKEKIELQVNQSKLKLKEAQEKYLTTLSSQREADENLRYATLGLKEGVIPVSNVIEAQTAWLSAKTGNINAEIELRLADIYLKRALGVIK